MTTSNAFLSPAVSDADQNLYNEESGSANIATGTVAGTNVVTFNLANQTFAGQNPLGYLYQYLAVKYATDANGSDFSDSPTNANYYALRNSAQALESTNPADYSYYLTTGFGTTNFLWYQTIGGRQIAFYIGPTAPSGSFIQAGTGAIDLDTLSGAAASFSVTVTARTTMDTTTDPDTWAYSTQGNTFKGASGMPKYLVPTVYIGAVKASWAIHQTYQYSWSRNGMSFTPSISQPLTNRWLEVQANDVVDGADQFICSITTT